MKILVIDDDVMMLAAITQKLKEKQYVVSTTTDAAEALKILGEDKIDLVICDIVMPGVSGLTFLSILKNFYFSKVPLILISSYAQDKVLKDAYNMGANYFISKPIDYDLLLQKVQELTKTIPINH